MKKIKYIVKEVGKDFEIRKHDSNYLPSKELGCDVASSFYLGNGLYCLYDDFGIANYLNGKSEYNFNLPSGILENKIFGKAIFIRANYMGEDIDVLDEDLLIVKKYIFYDKVSKEYLKSMGIIIEKLDKKFENLK